jgi:tetratricopeptide (TPR) repeat protein
MEKSLAEFESSAGLLIKADYLQTHHRFPEALEVVNRILEAEPANLGATILAVKILVAQGKGKEAEEKLGSVPETPLSSLLFLRGQVAETNGDDARARKYYQTAILNEKDAESASESALMRGVLARLELRDGNLDEARSLLESAHGIPVEQPLTEILRAEAFAREGEYSKAAELLREGFQHYRDPVFLVRLGEVQQESGSPDNARKSFEAAASLLERDPLGHERDLALTLHYLDPAAHSDRIRKLMGVERSRREDRETKRIEKLVLP